MKMAFFSLVSDDFFTFYTLSPLSNIERSMSNVCKQNQIALKLDALLDLASHM